jgi:hypothetical protein
VVVFALGIVAAWASQIEASHTDNSLTAPDPQIHVGEHAALVLDALGYPVVAYFDLPNFDLRVLHCDDPNCAGDESGNISVPDEPGDSTGQYNAIVLDAEGNPLITFYHTLNLDLGMLHCDDPHCAGDETGNIRVIDTPGFAGGFSSLALDENGYPVVAYQGNLGLLRVLHCDDAECAGDEAGNIATPDAGTASYIDMSFDALGNPVIAYTDFGALKLLHCDDPSCVGDESSNISVVEAGDAAWSALALDSSGHPVISYWDIGAADLKVVHCDDPGCAGDESANIQTPDTASFVGDKTAIVLSPSGNPIIAYAKDENVTLLHCDDAGCAGDESSNMMTVGLGTGPALVLDAAANPVIAYWGYLRLQIFHCGSPDCVPDPEPSPTDTTTVTATSTVVVPTATPTPASADGPSNGPNGPRKELSGATPLAPPEATPEISTGGAPPAAAGADGGAGAGILAPDAGAGQVPDARAPVLMVTGLAACGLVCLALGGRLRKRATKG